MPQSRRPRWSLLAVFTVVMGLAPLAHAQEVVAPAGIELSSLQGNWKLVAVLSDDRPGLEDRGALDIDWSKAGASFRTLFGESDELLANFVGAPLSRRGGVAGGSLTFIDPAKGTLQLSSQSPAPTLRTLETLDAGLLPDAFALAEREGEAQFVFVRRDVDDATVEQSLIDQASARAQLPVAATLDRP